MPQSLLGPRPPLSSRRGWPPPAGPPSTFPCCHLLEILSSLDLPHGPAFHPASGSLFPRFLADFFSSALGSALCMLSIGIGLSQAFQWSLTSAWGRLPNIQGFSWKLQIHIPCCLVDTPPRRLAGTESSVCPKLHMGSLCATNRSTSRERYPLFPSLVSETTCCCVWSSQSLGTLLSSSHC